MNLIKIGTVVIILAGVAVAADFRNNSWGDTPDQVRAVEGMEELKYTAYGEPYLDYAVDLASQTNVRVLFYFTAKECLAGGRYIPSEYGYEPFQEWENILTDKYSEPEIADIFHSDNDFIKENYYYGGWRDVEYGVAYGHFELCRYWTVNDTYIYIELVRWDDNALAGLKYFSTVYADEFNAQSKAAAREGF